MKPVINTLLMAAALATTALSAGAATIPHSKTIVVESPSQLPVLAEKAGEAMYLYDTGDGRTLLYLEGQGGHELSALDVTDPARIKAVTKIGLAAKTVFDFVQDVGGRGELIRYRDGSGVALLSFKKCKHPVLAEGPTLDRAGSSEALGETGLLLTSDDVVRKPTSDPRNYTVLDTSNPSQPALLASIPVVKQCLTKADTGTLFLLNNDGVTVVRRLRVEQEHQIDLTVQRGN
jgi:hypothetical protein